MQAKHPVIHTDLVSVGAAAQMIGVHPDTIKRWEASGRLSSFRLPNGHRRYNRADVAALLNTEASA